MSTACHFEYSEDRFSVPFLKMESFDLRQRPFHGHDYCITYVMMSSHANMYGIDKQSPTLSSNNKAPRNDITVITYLIKQALDW